MDQATDTVSPGTQSDKWLCKSVMKSMMRGYHNPQYGLQVDKIWDRISRHADAQDPSRSHVIAIRINGTDFPFYYQTNGTFGGWALRKDYCSQFRPIRAQYERGLLDITSGTTNFPAFSKIPLALRDRPAMPRALAPRPRMHYIGKDAIPLLRYDTAEIPERILPADIDAPLPPLENVPALHEPTDSILEDIRRRLNRFDTHLTAQHVILDTLFDAHRQLSDTICASDVFAMIGKLEQELPAISDVKLRGNHVIVTRALKQICEDMHLRERQKHYGRDSSSEWGMGK